MKKEKARKIGIMGGTFDPIHIGHLILGENAWHQFGLEKVLFMPSANPPHKPNRIGRADIQERVDMVRGAIADNPHFELSLEEAFREDYCYTSETLQEMTVKHPDTEYYFIMGADSLFAFETWHEPQKICQNCVIVAAVRDHVSAEHFKEDRISHSKISGGYPDPCHTKYRRFFARDPGMDPKSEYFPEILCTG